MMAPMKDQREPVSAQRIGPILWRQKHVILASTAVMLMLALIYTARSAKVYEATAVLQVSIPNQSASTDTTTASQGLAQNYATLLVSRGFLESNRAQIERGRLDTAELESRLSASALQQTALVELHSTGPSPQAAQRLGQQVINAFLASLQTEATNRTAQQQGQVQATINGLSARITALQASPNAGVPPISEQISSLQASRQSLIEQNATLVANGLAQGTSATLSSPPAASSTPIKPRLALNLIAGLLLGALLGVGLAWLRENLQPRLRSAEEAAALLNVPLLASIPLKARLDANDQTLLEAYDVLHTNLLFALRTQQMRLVTFVGPNPQVGKSSAVEGLAKAASGDGRNILVVDGDMRAGVLSSRLGKSGHVGMAEVLQGEVSLDDALISLGHGLSLLPTHRSNINPPSLLASSNMRSLSAELHDRFDIVLIDSPPIADLADGLILASLSDAVVMVARTGLTKPADLTAAATSLRHSQTLLVGIVVFEERQVESYYPATRERVVGARDPAMLS